MKEIVKRNNKRNPEQIIFTYWLIMQTHSPPKELLLF